LTTYSDILSTSGTKRILQQPGSKSILAGSVIAVLFLVAALLGSVGHRINLYPYSPNEVDFVNFDTPPSPAPLRALLDRREYSDYESDGSYHIFGTDNDGRDVFIRVCGGASTYLFAGLFTILISLVAGVALGSSEYYAGGVYDTVSRFIVSVIDSYPRVIILIIVAFISNFNLYALTGSLGLLNATRIARIVSSVVASLKNSDAVSAAKEIGLSDLVIILKHIVWYNCRQLLSVQIVYGLVSVILIEATLSYIGYGVGEPLVSWGRMIYEGAGGRYPFNLVEGIYWQVIPPAAAIVVSVLGLNLLADGLNKRISRRQTEYL
jgi:ABC-type dipeptide/oligopeptide/nickel transport system permease subunit